MSEVSPFATFAMACWSRATAIANDGAGDCLVTAHPRGSSIARDTTTGDDCKCQADADGVLRRGMFRVATLNGSWPPGHASPDLPRFGIRQHVCHQGGGKLLAR